MMQYNIYRSAQIWKMCCKIGAATHVVQVQQWEAKDASAYPTAVVESSTAKRRKVYFGCRDIYDDPQVCELSC